jgi:hypothetical protein
VYLRAPLCKHCLRILSLSFYWDPTTKPFVISGRDWEVPHRGPTLISVSLNFSTEEIRGTKTYFRVGTDTIDKGRKVVIHNVIAVPATEQHRLQQLHLVIAHLVICYEEGPRARPLSFRIPGENAEIKPLS